jgi:polyisoprenoid-binding protein YceI
MSTTPLDLDGTFTVDKVHSTASFAVKHMVVSTFRGSFEDLDAKLENGVLSGSVKVASVKVKDENLAAHLAAPDFFDTERYPEITFSSNAIERNGDEITVKGELTIKGHTNELLATGTIAGPATDIAGNEKIGLTLETTIDRTQYGLEWNAPLPKGGFALSNDVKLTVELELAAAAAE